MTSLFDRYLQESDAFSTKNKSPDLTKAQKCFKFTLLAANILFLIFASILMAFGSFAYKNGVGPLVGQTIPLGIVTLGVFILLLSFFGCFGAWKESRCFLGIYFAILLLFTIFLLAIGIAVYSQKDSAGYYIENAWSGANNDVRVSFQYGFNCCGLHYYNITAGNPCPTCQLNPCNTSFTSCTQPACATPCYDNFVSSFNSYYQSAGNAAIAISVLMFLMLLFVCVLIRAIRSRSEQADNETMQTGDDSSSPKGATVDTSV